MAADGMKPAKGSGRAPEWPAPQGILQSGPLRLGFLATIGVLLALLLGGAVSQLASMLTLIFLSIFISLGLYPIVTALERRGLPKPGAIAVVLAAFGILVATMLLLIVPLVGEQASDLVAALPKHLADIENQDWFLQLGEWYNDYPLLVLDWIRDRAADPNLWLAIGGGAMQVAWGVVDVSLSVILVIILTVYFVASLETMKRALYELVPGSQAGQFREIAEEIAESIGKYLGGQVVLAAITAVVSLVVMLAFGLPYALVIAFLGLLLALVPVIGNVIVTVLMVFVALFSSPVTAIVIALIMIVYMQIEAYIIAPRVIGKAIDIPASLVLIGALAGGTLMGLLGALVAAPVTASILLVIKKVLVPAQRLR